MLRRASGKTNALDASTATKEIFDFLFSGIVAQTGDDEGRKRVAPDVGIFDGVDFASNLSEQLEAVGDQVTHSSWGPR